MVGSRQSVGLGSVPKAVADDRGRAGERGKIGTGGASDCHFEVGWSVAGEVYVTVLARILPLIPVVGPLLWRIFGLA